MNSEIDKVTLPLTALTYDSRKKLSLLLNPNKVIPTDGAERLPRDWRGLASLLNIPSEVTSSLHSKSDKISKILEIWLQRRDNMATIGTLFEYLQRLDRFDVYDDLMELLKLDQLVHSKASENNGDSKPIFPFGSVRDDLITFDDVRHKRPQYYHAYVLYAKEDKVFVDELLSRMRSAGFKLCTEEDLLPGHATQYAPVSQLIHKRCHRIILVYSPDFLMSPANIFFRDYAQAISIEMQKPKIIPCMYRQCTLPTHLSFYHKLYYSQPSEKSIYNFWDKLSQSLEIVNLPRVQTSASAQKALENTPQKPSLNPVNPSHNTGFLPPVETKNTTTTPLPNGLPTIVENKLPESSERNRKKFVNIKSFFSNLKGKKQKEKVLAVEN